jgi:hypothetical protein
VSHVRRLLLSDRIFFRHAQECRERLDYMHMNPVRKGLVKRPEGWAWSSYNNYALDQEQVSRCRVRIDCADLPPSYRG